jgi:signal transduction histidine kinase/DNA-binding response OmpR family regulator/tetratricopeptide (TPR) repeat protein
MDHVSEPSTPDSDRSGQVVAGRFRLRGRLSEGTYSGLDLTDFSEVVVKQIPGAGLAAGAWMRLEYEVEHLQRLSSPWVISPYHLSRERDRLLLVSPYVPGDNLGQRLSTGPLTVVEALQVGRALFSALRDLHRHGLLHRAVRPSNIILPEAGDAGSAQLVGFGPARSVTYFDESSRRAILDAAHYASPEHAGSIDQDVTEASDLYSAGATLFHCLAGRPLFPGADLGAVLFDHMTAVVPELRSLGIGVPRAVDEIVQRLLRKDPRDRYQTAEAVLGDVEALLAALARGETDPDVVVGAHDERSSLSEPAFVGRRSELAKIDEQLDVTQQGRCGLVLLEGESGGGKTRLLAETTQRAACRGFWVLWGQGTSDVARQPFSLLGGVVETLLTAAKTNPRLLDAIRERLGDHAEAVGAALPGLAGVLGTAAITTGPEAAGEVRTLNALMRFVSALGSADRPVLVVLDDCQWADELTYRLIHRWRAQTGSEPAAGAVLLVASFRSEEVPGGHALRRMQPDLHLRLSPLATHEVRQLIESMAGPLPPEVVETVTRLADHSPFMASAVLRGLVEAGNLVPDQGRWRVESLDFESLQSSRGAASLLARRLEFLPPDALEFLSVGAILGKEFELDVAADLAAQTPAQAIAAVDLARQRQLVWLRPDGAHCVFVHDNIRAALLHRHAQAQRQSLHFRAARYLQARHPRRSADIAYHFDAAGDPQAALPYALEAAEQARARYALEAAEQQYLIAERGAAEASTATRYAVAKGLGETLVLRGLYDSAGEKLAEAAAAAEGTLARVEIEGKLGELAFKRGDMARAIECYEAALALLGKYVPQQRGMLRLLVLWEVFVQGLHTLLPGLFVHRCRRLPGARERLTLRLLSNLAHGYWYCRSVDHVLWAHLRGLNLAERFLPTPELAQSYAEHAPGLTLVGYLSRAEKYARKSLELRRTFGDWWGQGQSLHYWGVVLYAGSRFSECVEKCREGIRLLERTGDYWQVHIARYQIAASLYRLGDLAGALEESEQNYRSGLDLGDEQASGIILDVWVRATEGVVPQAVLQRESERKRHDAQGAAQVLLARALAAAGQADLDQAQALLEQGIAVADKAGIHNAYTLPCRVWLATLLRRQAQSADLRIPQRRDALLRRAQIAARAAIRASWICRNDLPHALRELALIRAMRGNVRSARRLLERSLQLAQRQGALFEYAQTLLARAELGHELGWSNADEQRGEALALLGKLRGPILSRRGDDPAAAPVSLSLSDRFDGVLDWGRRIASALSPEAIFDETRQAALRLLRAEHCLVLQIGDGEGATRFTPVAGSVPVQWSEARLQECLELRRAVGFAENTSERAPGKMLATGERSAICVPLHVRGAAVACLYVTHEHVRGLFGMVEERLADYIATIAGAALENAEGFTQLQQLNETLEVRVAERTAAAESRARELAQSNQELERLTAELRQRKQQLTDAKQAAEAASYAKSRFLAAISHEIRTPMNGVIGMTELALHTELSRQQRNYLTTVRQSAHSLLALLNDLLDFSKIEAGRMELESIPFSVENVVTDAARLLAVTASGKGLELVCRVDPNVPPAVLGDPNRLRQIVTNLVSNAIKFTEQGEVYVCIRCESGSSGAARLHFTVEDTGIGIPPEKQESIFEAFRQSDSSMTRRYGGTGLGLAISAELVNLMGGSIWVESEPGSGTTFHFVVDLPPVPGSVPSQPQKRADRTAARVTVLSANLHARRTYGEALERSGLSVECRETGVESYFRAPRRKSGRGKPDVVVFDVPASEPAESDVLQRLLQHRAAADQTPQVVVLLPAGRVDLSESCQRLGIGSCLTKPLKASELSAAVEAALQGGVAIEPERAETPTLEATRPLRVLVADDSPVNCDVAAGLLMLWGHDVRCVSTGRQAVEATHQERFDAVLMDVEMPEMDGLAATEHIRHREASRACRTPIFALSAHASDQIRQDCLAAGMDGFLHKPLDPRELFDALESSTAAASAGGIMSAEPIFEFLA